MIYIIHTASAQQPIARAFTVSARSMFIDSLFDSVYTCIQSMMLIFIKSYHYIVGYGL
jgi:hypothetical protein